MWIENISFLSSGYDTEKTMIEYSAYPIIELRGLPDAFIFGTVVMCLDLQQWCTPIEENHFALSPNKEASWLILLSRKCL